MGDAISLVTLGLAALACIFSILAWARAGRSGDRDNQSTQLYRQLSENLEKNTSRQLQYLMSQQNALQQTLTGQNRLVAEQLQGMALQTEQKLENIRTTMESRLASLQRDNTRQLDQMRMTVDEKMQKTLDEKLSRSFGLVSRQLEQVYKGLGEMQNLAAGVGDLKKVLSGVKTRGILGEVQLSAILEQLLVKDQYVENIATIPGSSERVEFALRLPGDGREPVYLPIDAKFPLDAYNALVTAQESADPRLVDAAAKALEQRVRSFAKDIRTKYVRPPHTTDFGIMFLPVEGLYAEVVSRGIADRIQGEFRVVVAGPTTMSALLNSLQMGFRTLAIQQRSSEVWKVLDSVTQEFETFGLALAQTQKRIAQAGSDLENLVGVRTRQIQRKLKAVGEMNPASAQEEQIPSPAFRLDEDFSKYPGHTS